MGYMDLSISGSDMAADMAAKAIDALVDVLEKGVEEKHSPYNTDGCVNVAMFFEEYINDGWADQIDDRFLNVAIKAEIGMREQVLSTDSTQEWDEEENRMQHQRRYKELHNVLKKFIIVDQINRNHMDWREDGLQTDVTEW